jgi:hypothetical protein
VAARLHHASVNHLHLQQQQQQQRWQQAELSTEAHVEVAARLHHGSVNHLHLQQQQRQRQRQQQQQQQQRQQAEWSREAHVEVAARLHHASVKNLHICSRPSGPPHLHACVCFALDNKADDSAIQLLQQQRTAVKSSSASHLHLHITSRQTPSVAFRLKQSSTERRVVRSCSKMSVKTSAGNIAAHLYVQ